MTSEERNEKNQGLLLNIPLALLAIGTLIAAEPATNEQLFLWINRIGNELPGLFWENVTTIGDGLVATVLLVVLFSHHPSLLRAGFVAAILASILSRALKWTFDADRPAAILDHDLFEIIGPTLSHSSFPSGHTIAVFTIAGLAVLHFSRIRFGVLLFAVALVGGFSRAVVGAHWPMDIFIGAVVGWLCAWMALQWIDHENQDHNRWISLFFLVASISLLFNSVDYEGAWLLTKIVAVAGLVTSTRILFKRKRSLIVNQ